MAAKVVMRMTWKHGPVMAAVNVAGGCLAAASVLRVWPGLALWKIVMVAVLAVVAAGVAVAAQQVQFPTAPFIVATVFAGAIWVVYAVATNPWRFKPLLILAIGAVVWGWVRMVVSHAAQVMDDEEKSMLVASRREKLAQEWQARIGRVCDIKGASIENIEYWETCNGYTIDGEVPPGGSTWLNIKQHEDGLAADARLAENCSVEVQEGANRAAFLIHVTTVDRLADIHPYPSLTGPRTIDSPVPIGVYRDGEVATADLRWTCGVTVGQAGSGKSNVLQVQTAGLVACSDVLVWTIDKEGAGLSLPWLAPFQAGEVHRPAVDWAAGSEAEARLMCKTAISIIRARKAQYQQLLMQVKDDKLPSTSKIPQIEIVVDEFTDLPDDVKNMLATIVRTGRAMRVRAIISTLRATSMDGSLPQHIQKHSRVRIGMRVSDREEFAYLFAWGKEPNVADAPYEGCGFIADGVPQPRAFRALRLTPPEIADIARTAADWQPTLDNISVAAAGDSYVTRWSRSPGQVLANAGGQNQNLPKESVMEADIPVTGSENDPFGLGAVDNALDKLRQRAAEVNEDDAAEEKEIQKFRSELDSLLPDENDLPEPLGAILGAFAFDERDYVSTADLAKGIGRGGQAIEVGRELADLGLKSDYKRRPWYGSQPARGFFLAALRQRAEEIRRGGKDS